MTKQDVHQTKQDILYLCRMTFKSFMLVMILGYTLIFSLVFTKDAHAASLISESIVNDQNIRASDIFSDVPEHKNVVIGKSPQPGQTLIINARTLQRVARANGIDWTSSSANDQVVLTRSSQTITSDMILGAIKDNLAAKGVNGNFGVTVNNVAPSMVIAGELPATIEVVQMAYTPGRDVFTAVIAAPNAANPVKTLSISGLVEKMATVPVLRGDVHSGDIIGSSDIEWIDVAVRHLVRDTILDADTLIGKTPLRGVAAGAPIRARDVISPQLVARGDEVLIQFTTGALQLSAKGKAMQNGAEGDVIRVLNLSSNQSLRAAIIGDKVVAVQ